MTPTPKQLLIASKDLRDQLAAVTNADWFKLCLVHVRGQLMERNNITPDMQFGMMLYESTLLSITDLPQADQEPMRSGIVHELDKGLRSREPKA